MKNSTFHEIEKEILKAKKILVVTHQGADGDAIGSLVSLGMYLKKIGKQPYLLCTSGVPDFLKSIPTANTIKSKHPETNFDLIIGVDYGSLIKLGIDSYLKNHPSIPLLVLDHHIFHNQGANFGIVDSKYSSTTELIYDYFKYVKFKIDKKIAYALLVGILSDTNFFKYSSSIKPMETATELAREFKIKPVEIDNNMNGQTKLEALKASGEIFSRTKLNKKGDFVYSWVKRRELSKHDLKVNDLRGIVDRLRTSKDGQFALLLVEENPGRVRGELRSRPDKKFDVAKLAIKMGGGGHKFSSGFRFKGSIDGALKAVSKYSSKQ
jgi:phosphoesterase RecJ-like protein